MEGLIKEIREIPEKAELCYSKNRKLKLPQKVPYIGMGSSYNAPLTLRYCGKEIYPDMASEYFYYLSLAVKPLAVLISQSGESSETVWCLDKFKKVIALTNYPSSKLGQAKPTAKIVELFAGDESYSSTKTYTNTLIALYIGLGIDPKDAVRSLANNFSAFESETKNQSQAIFKYLTANNVKGFYVLGSGPNIGTAYQGALTLSETTKLPWNGMGVAQYDHGPKETADNAVVLILDSHGRDNKRIESIRKVLEIRTGALVITIGEKSLAEELSPVTLITKVNLLMYHLAKLMKPGATFKFGSKVTKVSEKLK